MRSILVGLTLLAAAGPARAQMIWGGEYERALRPGTYVPYDGAAYSIRYYDVGPGIYINGDGWRLWYLEYLDRVERARKFGYAPPPPPRYGPYAHHGVVVDEVVVAPEAAEGEPREVIVEETPPMRGRLGLGFVLGRWRNR